MLSCDVDQEVCQDGNVPPFNTTVWTVFVLKTLKPLAFALFVNSKYDLLEPLNAVSDPTVTGELWFGLKLFVIAL